MPFWDRCRRSFSSSLVDHVVAVVGPADELSRGEPHADLMLRRLDGVAAVHDVAAHTHSKQREVSRGSPLLRERRSAPGSQEREQISCQ